VMGGVVGGGGVWGGGGRLQLSSLSVVLLNPRVDS